MPDLPVYEFERIFDAPRALVWRTWTEPELLAKWYGPGVETTIHKLDVRPGGAWHNEMAWGGQSSFERMDFKEVEPEQKLVWFHSMADKDFNIISNPMMENWPRVLLTTVSFEDAGDQTKVTLKWVPHEASEAELETFKAAMAGLNKGWGSGMDLLETILAELQAT